MRFTYTYSTTPTVRAPISMPNTQSSTDVLTMPLAPQEDTGDATNYAANGSCITVNIRVLDAKWL